MNTNVLLIVLSLSVLVACGEAARTPLSPERVAQNARLTHTWHTRCVDEGDCVGTVVFMQDGAYTVVTFVDMPYGRGHFDSITRRITEWEVARYLHNQAYTEHASITGFRFPEESETLVASES